jgi:hypothetical protein
MRSRQAQRVARWCVYAGMLAFVLLLVLACAGCAGDDALRRGAHEFPPRVPQDAEDGAYATRSGFVVMKGGVAWVFEF